MINVKQFFEMKMRIMIYPVSLENATRLRVGGLEHFPENLSSVYKVIKINFKKFEGVGAGHPYLSFIPLILIDIFG